jgi:potassium/hydrogen antiporter
MESPTFLVLLGGLLVIAFLAEDAMRRLGLPPVLVLMGCGILLGPVTGLLPAGEFARVAPHFGGLAFLLILFEGGLDLNLRAVLLHLAPGARLALTGFGVAAVCGFGLSLAAGFPPLGAVSFAVVMAPISGAIVIPLSGKLGLRKEVRTLVVLEGALSDVLGVLALGFVAQLVTGGGLAGLIAVGAVMAALVSVVAAVVAGLAWPRVLRSLGERRFVDVLTFGIALLLWGSAESTGASGALAVLSFGLTLANEHELLSLLHLGAEPVEELVRDVVKRLHEFIAQLTFLVRAFFFVFLGVVVRFDELRASGYLLAVAVVLLLAGSRWVVVDGLQRRGSLGLDARERVTVWSLLPRGLVTAVLAIEAAHLGLQGSEQMLGLASLVIIATNVIMAVGVRLGKAKAQAAPAAPPG